MKPRHVLSGRVRADALGFDLVERHRRRVDQAGARCTVVQQFGRDHRAGVEADGASPEKIASAHGDEVGRAGTGADEMDSHVRSLLAARAQVAIPTLIRGTISRDAGPEAASAAASATEGTPISASTRSERVCVRAPAA